jgi:hypothetical protein
MAPAHLRFTVPPVFSRRRALRAIVPVGLALVTVLGALPAPAHGATAPTQISTSAAWSWWVSPQAVQRPEGLYWTGITETGRRRVYRTTDGLTTYVDLGPGVVDDHNAPALSMEADQPTVVAYTDHPGQMRYRVAPADSIDFGPELDLPFGFTSTYTQILRRGAEAIVLTRADGVPLGGWQYVTTVDNFQTFSAPRRFFDATLEDLTTGFQSYALVRSFDLEPHRYHVAIYGHPRYLQPVGYRTVTFDQLLDPGFEPFRLWGGETVWQPEPVGAPDERVRLLDVGDKRGVTVVYYARWSTTAKVPQYYSAVRQPGGTWVSTRIASSGGPFATAISHYIGGIAIDRRPGVARIYLAHKDGAAWKLATYRLSSQGNPYLRVTLATSSVPLARPLSAGDGVIYQRLIRYRSYLDFDSSVYQVTGVAP